MIIYFVYSNSLLCGSHDQLYTIICSTLSFKLGHQKSTGYRNQQKFPVPCTIQDLPTKSRKVQARGTGDLQKMWKSTGKFLVQVRRREGTGDLYPVLFEICLTNLERYRVQEFLLIPVPILFWFLKKKSWKVQVGNEWMSKFKYIKY